MVVGFIKNKKTKTTNALRYSSWLLCQTPDIGIQCDNASISTYTRSWVFGKKKKTGISYASYVGM